MSKLRFGWAEIDLTPEKKYLLQVSLPKGFQNILKNL